ncbi:MAG: ubiquitin-like domain-containing protein [Oscillospiraceae bacterium]|nr:ubiquitin-like domain-containing protein [Oscillospiraceae bacterium]
MTTFKIELICLKRAVKRIGLRHKFIKKPALISVATLTLSVSIILLMTGVLWFKNDVMITDGDDIKKAFTMKDDPGEILGEFGYIIGEFDRVSFSGISGGAGLINITRGRGVTVKADGKTLVVGAIDGEGSDIILENSGLTVNEHDVVIESETDITLVRGFGVNITADGKTITIGTTGDTVGGVLKTAGISLGRDDIINIPLEAQINEGDEIIIKRVTFRERTAYEELPYETTTAFSNLIAIGSSVVIDGILGEVTVVYGEKLVDGVVVTSEVLSNEITREPSTEHITYGLALQVPYSKRDFAEINLVNGLPVDYVQVLTGKATAYTARPTSGTASGRKLEIGTVAVDPKIIPYGSLLYIVSVDGKRVYGAAIAADTGHLSEHGVLVDVFMGTHDPHLADAMAWGAQQVNVYIINTGVY